MAQKEAKLDKIRIETLDRENTSLQSKLSQAELRVMQLENIFTAQGCTKEQIDMMIERMANMQMAA